jgi:hypothetical protein
VAANPLTLPLLSSAILHGCCMWPSGMFSTTTFPLCWPTLTRYEDLANCCRLSPAQKVVLRYIPHSLQRLISQRESPTASTVVVQSVHSRQLLRDDRLSSWNDNFIIHWFLLRASSSFCRASSSRLHVSFYFRLASTTARTHALTMSPTNQCSWPCEVPL